MKKIISSIFLFIIIIQSAFLLVACDKTNSPSNASVGDQNVEIVDAASDGLIYEYINDGTEYSVASIGRCEDIHIIIPSIYKGKKVTQISSLAFYDNDLIMSVSLPDTIEVINSSAFSNCEYLCEIELSQQLIAIKDSAFYNCSRLFFAELPNTLTEIGESAFSGCSKLKSISLPIGITNIQKAAFENCSSLETFVITNGITEIGVNAFKNCVALKDVYVENQIILDSLKKYSTSYYHYFDRYADNLYVKEGLFVGENILKYYNKLNNSEKQGYLKYTKKETISSGSSGSILGG